MQLRDLSPVLSASRSWCTLDLTRDEVTGLGATTVEQGPLVSALLRAALATGADVALVPHQNEQARVGGVGAVLRYADDSTATS